MTFRVNPLTGNLVHLATNSGSRPQQHGIVGVCNFCPGNEAAAGVETGRVEKDDAWVARTWLNRWAVIDADTTPQGIHEVGTFSPEHHRTLGALTSLEQESFSSLLHQRLSAHTTAGQKSTVLLVNNGAVAGSSVYHPHFQLYTFAETPPVLQKESETLSHGNCVLCDSSWDPAHIVTETKDSIVMVAPWGDRDGELLIYGKTHDTPYENLVEGLHLGAKVTEANEGADVPYKVGGHPSPLNARQHAHIHLTPHPEKVCSVGMYAGYTVLRKDPLEVAAHLRTFL